VFVPSGLEKDPRKAVTLSLQNAPEVVLGPDNPRLTAVESEDLRDILEQLNFHCSTRGYSVKILFGDFDHNNDGQITADQFKRNIFVLCPNLSMAEADLIVKAYGAPLGVNYRELDSHCSDITLPAPEDDTKFGRMAKPEDAITVSERLANETVKTFAMKFAQTPGIRMAEYFRVFDKKKQGWLKVEEFLQAVVRCFGSMTKQQTKALAASFANGDIVDWRYFVDAIERMASELTYDRTPGFCKTTNLSESEKLQVEDILRDICQKVSHNRIMLKPSFQDFDRRNEDHVSREQFMRALSMFSLLPYDSSAIDLLCAAFCPTSHKHGSKYVNYRKFLDYIEGVVSKQEAEQLKLVVEAYKDVPRHLRTDFTPKKEDYEIDVPPAEVMNVGNVGFIDGGAGDDSLGSPEVNYDVEDSLGDFAASYDFSSVTDSYASPSKASVHLGRPDKPLSVVIADIRKSVLQNRIRLVTFFEDQDKLRKGKISRSQFYRGLTNSGHRLSEYELSQLCTEFVASDDVDGDGMPLVRWNDFVKTIEQVFTIDGLEQQPQLDVNSTIRDIRENSSTTYDQRPDFTAEENARLCEFLSVFSKEMCSKCVDLFPPFEDFDRFHKGTVTANMFARVLSGLGFYPGQDVFDLLVEKFKDEQVDSQKDVNYKAFIRAITMIGDGVEPANVPSTIEYKRGMTFDTVTPFDPSQYVIKSPQRPVGFGDLPTGDIASILEEVRRQIDYGQVRLADFLGDGDRLRSGHLSTSKFRNGLARGGVRLAGGELTALEDRFRSAKRTDQVDWRAFLVGVENARILTQPEAEDSGVDQEQLRAVLAKISEIVAQRRLNLKPYFQDYDKSNFQQVTNNQFCAAMSTLSIPLSMAERELLCNAFMVRDGSKPTNRVYYKPFIKRVDNQ